MKHSHASFGAVGVLFGAFTLLGASALAGPLNPPAGPIGSTQKPLAEVEPRTAINTANTPGDASSVFRITQPGSYYLTGNVTGVSGRHGIEIAANNVTIDLAGFTLAGVPGSLNGIADDSSAVRDVVVRNGTLTAWGASGVNLASGLTTTCEGLTVSSCAGGGLRAGTSCLVRGCNVFGCAGAGIVASADGVITDCTVRQCAGAGISTGNGATVTNCSSRDNTTGIAIGPGATVHACAAHSNSGDGIHAAGGEATITACSARLNGGRGFNIQFSCTITDCTATSNTLDGIFATSACLIRGNCCVSNGAGAGSGAGIFITGNDNRIEGNACTFNDRGIDVNSSDGSVIVRNTCASNTLNWEIASNNVFGPIIDRSTPASASVSGNSAPSSLGSTDANANYTH